MLLETSPDNLLVDGVISDVNEKNLVKFTVVEIVGCTEACRDETVVMVNEGNFRSVETPELLKM